MTGLHYYLKTPYFQIHAVSQFSVGVEVAKYKFRGNAWRLTIKLGKVAADLSTCKLITVEK